MNRARAGMTLIELVIAITILAMMVTGGSVAFGTIIDRQETIRHASAEVERAAALRETLRQWILQGEPQIQRGGVPRGARGAGTAAAQIASVAPGSRAGSTSTASVTAAASTGNELTFTTNAPNPLMAANVRIRLFVDADDNTPEQGLTIEYQASTQTPLMRRQLDPSVGDLTVEFYDQRTSRWIASTEASTGQPIALRITMIPADGVTLPRLLTLPLTIVFGDIAP
jgi:prepilin-type N-terminal cleavage/methylation domain-containing protein